MSFNLNSPLGFAQATNSVPFNPVAQAATILNIINGANQWNINEAAYNGAPFHIFKTASTNFQAGLPNNEDSCGRRKAVYQFPYVDGQSTVDLGRDGEVWSFDCIFFGSGYYDGWQALYQQLNTSSVGSLIHPVRGTFQAVPKSWRITYSSEKYMAMTVHLEFIEHTFNLKSSGVSALSALGLFDSIKSGLNSALTTLNTLNNSINNAFTSLSSAFNVVSGAAAVTTAVRNTILNDMTAVTNLFGSKVIRLNSTYNAGNSIDIPAAATPLVGGTTSLTGASIANSVSVSVNPNSSGVDNSTDITIPGATPYTTAEAVADTNTYSASVTSLISTIKSSGQELLLYQQILDFQASAIVLQRIVATGVQNQQPQVLNYTTPNLMSLRQVAFNNGLTPDALPILDAMNPTLDSVNYILPGTVLQVPVAA